MFVGSFGRLCHGVVYVQDETENCYEQKVLIKTITGRMIHKELCPLKYKADNSQIQYLIKKLIFKNNLDSDWSIPWSTCSASPCYNCSRRIVRKKCMAMAVLMVASVSRPGLTFRPYMYLFKWICHISSYFNPNVILCCIIGHAEWYWIIFWASLHWYVLRR